MRKFIYLFVAFGLGLAVVNDNRWNSGIIMCITLLLGVVFDMVCESIKNRK